MVPSRCRYAALCLCIACGSSSSTSPPPARPAAPAVPVPTSPLCDAVAQAIAALPNLASIERGEPRQVDHVSVFDTRFELRGLKNVVNRYDDGRIQWNVIWPKGTRFDAVATELKSCRVLAGRTPVDATHQVMEGRDEHTLSWDGLPRVELSIALDDLELTVEGEVAPPVQPARAATPGDCSARVEKLAALIKSADFDAIPSPMPPNVSLAKATAEQRPYLRPTYAPTFVIVSPSAIMIDGTTIWTSGHPLNPVRGALHTRINDLRKQRRDQLELTLAIARDARWDEVVTTMDGIAGAQSRVLLAFEAPRALPPKPPASELANRLMHADPAALTVESERLLHPCPAASALLPHSPNVDPSQRAHTYVELAKHLPAAIESCGCVPSPEDVGTWLWHAIWSGETPGVRTLSISSANESTSVAGVAVKFPAAQTWELAAPTVINSAGLQYGQTKSVRLQVAP
jgi:hypothetical protein